MRKFQSYIDLMKIRQKTIGVIPARLAASRFPNKPLEKINNIPMIIHVLNRAKESKVGEVIVATPDNEILQIVKHNGGKAILTSENHHSGSDRIYEAYMKELKNNVEIIINLQGEMPNIKPTSISICTAGSQLPWRLANLLFIRQFAAGELASK